MTKQRRGPAREHIDYETNDRAVGVRKGWILLDFLLALACLAALGGFTYGVGLLYVRFHH